MCRFEIFDKYFIEIIDNIKEKYVEDPDIIATSS